MKETDAKLPRPTEQSTLLPLKAHGAVSASLTRGDLAATLRLIGTAGSGLVADGYGLGVTNIVLAILGHLYPAEMLPSDKGLIVSVALVGVIAGQLAFGGLADVVGRRTAALATSMLMIVGTAASAVVVDSPWCGIAFQLTLARCVLGFGIGGEYPLSAAIAKEAEAGGQVLCLTRSQLLIVNMCMFNVGILLQFFLVLLFLGMGMPLERVWRVLLACGMFPAAVALVLRLQMKEPPKSATLNLNAAPESYFSSIKSALGPRWPVLLGACTSWLLFNFVSYSQTSFSAVVYDRTFGDAEDSPQTMVHKDAIFGLVTTLSSIVGSVFAFFVVDRLSRRDMQFLGFSALALLLIAASYLFSHADGPFLMKAFYIIYCFVGFSMSFIGITSYLVPSESFPASVRGTCVGLAAASGKLGAVMGTAVFPAAEENLGLSAVLFASGVVMVFGCAVTASLTPHRGDLPELKDS